MDESPRDSRLVDAYLDRTIDKPTYREHGEKIDEDTAAARVALTEATDGEIDVEAVLAFAERALGDPWALWRSLPVAKKARLQRAIFPEGLSCDRSGYRTPLTSDAFAACAWISRKGQRWCTRGTRGTRSARVCPLPNAIEYQNARNPFHPRANTISTTILGPNHRRTMAMPVGCRMTSILSGSGNFGVDPATGPPIRCYGRNCLGSASLRGRYSSIT
jgi:hypothetical protein